MKKKHHSEEQIVAILREADEGRSVEEVCRERNISKASLHRWKTKCGQMELRSVKRLKELERGCTSPTGFEVYTEEEFDVALKKSEGYCDPIIINVRLGKLDVAEFNSEMSQAMRH